ncbi:MAG: uracil-DNA glycosylase family protein [Thermodesulfobacteriota bacterium]
MPHPFDPGYSREPFRTLCEDYPGTEAYPGSEFRVEWGPIFHRGRLDGSARVLVIGQDPAQHETVVRRILVGAAGRRLQGYLAKLGITRSYVLINAFLYSVYGKITTAASNNPLLVAYRHRWLDALILGQQTEAVITLGTWAKKAWQTWAATPQGQSMNLTVASITHPTQPESSSNGDEAKLAAATKALLKNWNAGLEKLAPAISHPDQPVPLVLYGDAFAEGDYAPIPSTDLPAGVPAWMYEKGGWAQRVGSDARAKRANITITVPKEVLP